MAYLKGELKDLSKCLELREGTFLAPLLGTIAGLAASSIRGGGGPRGSAGHGGASG